MSMDSKLGGAAGEAGDKTAQAPPSAGKSDMLSAQVELARRMAERQMAMQVGAVRELMTWFVPFVVTSYSFLFYGYRKTNNWVVMFPLIPITFGLGYQLHYAFGNKTNQIKALAEKIMVSETHMMAVPEWSSSSALPRAPQEDAGNTSTAAGGTATASRPSPQPAAAPASTPSTPDFIIPGTAPL